MRERVEGATPSSSATASSLNFGSRKRRSSEPRRRLRTVGPMDTRLTSSEGCQLNMMTTSCSNRITAYGLDKKYDTAKMGGMKSQLGFHVGNLCHALARRRRTGPSSVLAHHD